MVCVKLLVFGFHQVRCYTWHCGGSFSLSVFILSLSQATSCTGWTPRCSQTSRETQTSGLDLSFHFSTKFTMFGGNMFLKTMTDWSELTQKSCGCFVRWVYPHLGRCRERVVSQPSSVGSESVGTFRSSPRRKRSFRLDLSDESVFMEVFAAPADYHMLMWANMEEIISVNTPVRNNGNNILIWGVDMCPLPHTQPLWSL